MRCEDFVVVVVFFFHASYLHLNEFMAFVDFLDFHENWPERS